MDPLFPLRVFIQNSVPLFRELIIVYDRIPSTRCLRQVWCCSLLPEMTFLEALQVISTMESWPPSARINVIRKAVRYFLGNAAEISSCPFLQGKECRIYPDRFFGCRAYGLWSGDYYQALADKNRQGKLFLQQQWEKLGISLSEDVVSFQVPYCSRVEIDPPGTMSDELLSSALSRVENLSLELNLWDRKYREEYFSDLSYFLTGLQFGPQEAVRLKFFITKDIIQKGDRTRLELALNQVTDPFLKET